MLEPPPPPPPCCADAKGLAITCKTLRSAHALLDNKITNKTASLEQQLWDYILVNMNLAVFKSQQDNDMQPPNWTKTGGRIYMFWDIESYSGKNVTYLKTCNTMLCNQGMANFAKQLKGYACHYQCCPPPPPSPSPPPPPPESSWWTACDWYNTNAFSAGESELGSSKTPQECHTLARQKGCAIANRGTGSDPKTCWCQKGTIQSGKYTRCPASKEVTAKLSGYCSCNVKEKLCRDVDSGR